jgi:hypothetical protein
LALLLASFGSNVLSGEKEDDDNKIGEAIDRIQRFFCFLIRIIFRLFSRKKSTMIENNMDETITYNRVCVQFIYLFHFISFGFSLVSFCNKRIS